MKHPKRLVLIFFATALLASAVGVQVYAVKAYPYTSSLDGRPLARVISTNPPGWTSTELPIAESDAAVGNVEQILRYDDVLFRRYSRGNIKVDVYVAYWLPGKMSYWDVGTHNPDSCWVYNGFKRTDRRFAVERMDTDLPLKPFEYGRFIHTGHQIDVIFWHMVGDQPNRYQEQPEGWRNGLAGRIERFPLMVKDMTTYGLDMHREQFFIRISTSQAIIPLMEDPYFRALLKSLAPLGILADRSSSSAL